MSASRRLKRSVARSTTVAGAVAGIAGLTLTGPVGAAAATETGSPQVINRETVQATLDPQGELETARLYSQLTVLGKGQVDVSDPTSGKNVRDLDGFSAPLVRDGKAQYSITVDGREDRRTVADYTGEMPVTLKAEYTLDGERVDPEDVVGKSGKLEATYTVVNRTATPTEITYEDHAGTEIKETVDLVTPYVGSLKVLLPSSYSGITADRADVAGDGRGANGVSWSLVLFNPLGEPAQQLTWSAEVTDAVLPPANLQVVPVVPGGNAVLESGLTQIGDGATAATALTAGAFKIDGKLLELRDGASKILDGLTELSAGARALEAGLADTAAPGAQALSDGLGAAREGGETLGDGLGKLAAGGKTLNDGLGAAAKGGSDLSAGLDQLVSGGGRLIAGLDSAAAGGTSLATGLGTLEAGLGSAKDGSGQLAAGLTSANTGAASLAGGLPELASGLDKIQAGLTQLGGQLPLSVKTGVDQLRNAVTAIAVARYIDGGLVPGVDALTAGIDAKVLPGLNALEASLDAKVLPGIAGLQDAVTGKLVPGIDEVLAGVPASAGKLNCAAKVLADVQNGVGPAVPGADPCYPGGRPTLPGVVLDPTSQAVLGGVAAGLQQSAADLVSTAVDADGKPVGLTGALTALKGGLNSTAVDADGRPLSVLGGLNQLYAGLDTLAKDADGVPLGVRGGIQALEQGIATDLKGGLALLRAGLTHPSAKNPDGSLVLDPATGLPTDPGGLREFLVEQIDAGLARLNAGVASGLADALGAPTTDKTSPLAATLIGGTSLLAAGADAAAAGSGQLAGGLAQLEAGGLKLDGGLAQLLAGGTSAAAGATTLSSGLDQLASGGGALSAGAGAAAAGATKLSGGLDQLAAGGGTLVAGLDAANAGGAKLVDGLGQLDDGGAKLAAGLKDAADGSGKIADGVDAVKDGVTQVESGATRLSGEGTSLLAGSANTAAKGASKNAAMLVAMREKAADGALPYGLPADAQGTAAFSVVLAGANSEASDSTTRGAAALALLTLGSLSGFVLRRRFVS